MLPKWYNINEIPFDKMWPDDEFWYPLVLKGKKFKGKFHFQGEKTILSQSIEEVNCFS